MALNDIESSFVDLEQHNSVWKIHIFLSHLVRVCVCVRHAVSDAIYPFSLCVKY